MHTIPIESHERVQLLDVSAEINRIVGESGVRAGACLVFCPHTTAAVTINENADPSVPQDLVMGLGRVAPRAWPYRHGEGNSDAHLKSSLIGCSEYLIVEDGAVVLGTWQGVYFCEFDGPRRRKLLVQVLPQQGAPAPEEQGETTPR